MSIYYMRHFCLFCLFFIRTPSGIASHDIVVIVLAVTVVVVATIAFIFYRWVIAIMESNKANPTL